MASLARHRRRNNPISLQAAPLEEEESVEVPAGEAEPDTEARGGGVKAASDRPAEEEEAAACLGGEAAEAGPGGTKSKEEASESSSWAARQTGHEKSKAAGLSGEEER
ncbi:hypothetical protein AK812_SmicGene40699 [Symbiodinium microadriaticum]|uniref:Uncharacterized protein n=1 Tax=Symbiodinium microadriaticum TaxID=2951 RepID=A0A1Q9C807_SYMMI|nr:hypothetical protein AK812_SmicGene40699 [Symbiodinium microadriaticum]